MSYNRGPDQDVSAAYEAMNASYRMLDEYMRQSQLIAERVWMPWIRPFVSDASPFIPPEEWVRAYGEWAMAWMSWAQAWTNAWSFGAPPGAPPRTFRDPPFAADGREWPDDEAPGGRPPFGR